MLAICQFRSPAVDSLRQFGKLLLDKMKRRRSEPIHLLSPATGELVQCPLEKLCRRPREFQQKGHDERTRVLGRQTMGGGGGRPTDGVGRRARAKERWLVGGGGRTGDKGGDP